MKRFILGTALALAGFASIIWAAAPAAQVDILGHKFYTYEVKKGESLYGIAKQMGWDEKTLTDFNPGSAQKLKAGETIYYPADEKNTVADRWAEPANKSTDKIAYTLESGDTPLGVARKFHTTLASVYKDNPSLSEKNFPAGKTITITPNLDQHRLRTDMQLEQVITGIKRYKVKSNESWNGIAAANGISAETLLSANPDVKQLKKNAIIMIPVIENREVAKTVVDYDPRELTAEGRQEILDSVSNPISLQGAEISASKIIHAAIVLSKPSSNKDIDFTRGFVTALRRMKDSHCKVELDVVDGSSPASLASNKQLQNANIIFATYDKDFPASLAKMADEHGIMLVNVFDLKSDLWKTNSNFVQLLPPSEDFNRLISQWATSALKGKSILIVGESDPQDTLTDAVLNAYPDNISYVASNDHLARRDFMEGQDYAVISFAKRKSEISQLLETIAKLRTENPATDIITLGRGSWMAYEESLRKEMATADTYFPSRFYFDRNTEKGKAFTEAYRDLFRQQPVKSSPMFSVAGYDVAEYFLPRLSKAALDVEMPADESTLQTEINLKSSDLGLGQMNEAAYMIHVTADGSIDKIVLK